MIELNKIFTKADFQYRDLHVLTNESIIKRNFCLRI